MDINEKLMMLFEKSIALRQLLITKGIISQEEWEDALQQAGEYLKTIKK